MTSEIRANTLKNRVGLGTISFTNTGAVVSGIVTANSFSGTGDLDVDGHTELDNTNIVGIVTVTNVSSGIGIKLIDSSSKHYIAGCGGGGTPFVGSFTGHDFRIQVGGNQNAIFKYAAGARGNFELGPSSGIGITFNGATGNAGYAGIVTATTFVGNLTGNVTGNISGGTVAGSTGAFSGDVSITDKIVHTDDTNTTIRFPANDTISFETAGTERVRIDSSGRIIQNYDALPSVSSNLPYAYFAPVKQTYGGVALTMNLHDDATNDVGNGGGLGFSGNSSTGSPIVRAAIRGNVEATNSTAGYLTLHTRDAGGNTTEKVRITSTGQFQMGGGNSWTYASQKFVVVEPNNNLGMLLQGNNANEGVNLTLQNIVNANNAYSSLSFADDGGQIFGVVRGKVIDKNANTGELQFHTSSNERLSITSSGISKFKNFGGGQIWLGGDSAHTAKVTVTDNAGTGNGNFVFAGPSGTHLKITSAGTVIVGGTSLGASGSFGMEPNGHVRSVLPASTAGDTLLGAIYGVSNGFQINIDASNNQTYKFHNGTSQSLTITSAGKVGIGDDDPDYMIQLKGSIPAIAFEETDGTYGVSIIEQNNDNLKIRCDAGNASSGTGSNIRFEVDGSERMRIENLGDNEFGAKFFNSKAIEFKDQGMGIFTLTWSINANTWTNFFSIPSYFQGWLFVNGTHNSGNSSALWSISNSYSGGAHANRFAHDNLYSPGSSTFRINGVWVQIKTSYNAYGTGTLIVLTGGNSVANLSG